MSIFYSRLETPFKKLIHSFRSKVVDSIGWLHLIIESLQSTLSTALSSLPCSFFIISISLNCWRKFLFDSSFRSALNKLEWTCFTNCFTFLKSVLQQLWFSLLIYFSIFSRVGVKDGGVCSFYLRGLQGDSKQILLSKHSWTRLPPAAM